MPTNKNNTFDIQTAMAGCITPDIPKVLKTCIDNKKANVIKIPIPRCIPVPPLDLREETPTASNVNTKKENGEAIRL